MNKPVNSEEAEFITLGIRITGRKCLVIGGGDVGCRKAKKLIKHGGEVTIVSPEINDELNICKQDHLLTWICDTYNPSFLESAFLVVAATSDGDLNKQICRDAEARNILACDVSSQNDTGIIFPAEFDIDEYNVSVHSNGKNVVGSKELRDGIASFLNS